MIRRTLGFFAITVAACLCIPLASSVYNGFINTPQRALERFKSDDASYGEDTLMDELILAGDEVVPLVLREVVKPDRPRRRYAIGFLGNGSYRAALPTLEDILKSECEKDYFRADALRAIYEIDSKRAMALARRYRQNEMLLGQQAREILRGRYVPFKRSYEDAAARRHY